MKQRNHISRILFVLGVLCLIAAGGLATYNFYLEQNAGKSADKVLAVLNVLLSDAPKDQAAVPEEISGKINLGATQTDMSLKTIDNRSYVAILSIPALDLELPVINELTNSNLKIAPCLYQGSIDQNNVIIGAHNYKTHFGQLKSLEVGDSITLTDMAGNTFFYQISETEILGKTDVDELNGGEWDLTLFTCTYGGEHRIIVRCDQILSDSL